MESFQGQLVPSGGVMELHSPFSGYISKSFTTIGAQVRKGEPLVEIVESRIDSPLGNTAFLVHTQFEVQRRALERQIEEQRQLARTASTSRLRKLQDLEEEGRTLTEQTRLQQQKVDDSGDLWEKMKPLRETGVISAVQFQQQKATWTEDQVQLRALSRQRKDLDIQLNDARKDQDDEAANAAIKIADNQRQIAALSSSEAQDLAQRDSVIRSPTDGKVSNLIFSPGQAVKADSILATVVPGRSRMYARVLIPSHAIGHVTLNQMVHVKYRSLPFQQFGQFRGRVTEISSSGIDQPPTGAKSTDGSESTFIVKISVNDDDIRADDRTIPLLSGTSLDVDIPIEKRTLLSWMFSPFARSSHAR
ncbi:HlyD family secretion protein [Luteibacter mycovicinus]|uniref:HlyD family secretion protein n=1 Tax=Luteibacter mycovicinus TaxID=1500890 RepID=UPI0018CD245A|nr:HlyD family efflux transporter periplasmic adaptor subunit [Luteibacter sp. 9143a]